MDTPSGGVTPASFQEDTSNRPSPARAEDSFQTAASYQREVERVSPPVPPERSPPVGNISTSRGDYFNEGREFGVEKRFAPSDKVRTVDGQKKVERTDGGTSGSLVAEMRNRYSSNSGSTSPPPRNLPRPPLSVSDLASRYQPGDAPISPRARAVSPPVLRQLSLPPPETAYQSPDQPDRFINGHRTGLSISGSSQTPTPEDRRRQRIDDLASLELAEKERELRQREYDIEMRSRELERDRARLLSIREGGDDGERTSQSAHNSALRPRERRTSLRQQLQRPLSQMELEAVNEPVQPLRPRSQLSPNRVHAAPSLSSSNGQNSPQATQEQRYDQRSSTSTMDSNTTASTSQHAPYCGCSTCSIAKYKTSTTPTTNASKLNEKSSNNSLKPPSEKPKSSWMRRLSMPVSVGNAFNLDSKRNIGGGNYGLGSGVSNTIDGGGRGLFSQKNTSATALGSPLDGGLDRVEEDGRLGRGNAGALGGGRRSYDLHGPSNRSMTNLGMTGRR